MRRAFSKTVRWGRYRSGCVSVRKAALWSFISHKKEQAGHSPVFRFPSESLISPIDSENSMIQINLRKIIFHHSISELAASSVQSQTFRILQKHSHADRYIRHAFIKCQILRIDNLSVIHYNLLLILADAVYLRAIFKFVKIQFMPISPKHFEWEIHSGCSKER